LFSTIGQRVPKAIHYRLLAIARLQRSKVGGREFAVPFGGFSVQTVRRIPDMSPVRVEGCDSGGFADLLKPGDAVQCRFIEPKCHLESIVVAPKAECLSL
jgi:hypothetical protein